MPETLEEALGNRKTMDDTDGKLHKPDADTPLGMLMALRLAIVDPRVAVSAAAVDLLGHMLLTEPLIGAACVELLHMQVLESFVLLTLEPKWLSGTKRPRIDVVAFWAKIVA